MQYFLNLIDTKKKCRKDVKAISGLMEAQKSTRAYREKIIPTP